MLLRLVKQEPAAARGGEEGGSSLSLFLLEDVRENSPGDDAVPEEEQEAAVVAVYCNWGGRQMHLVIEQGKATRLTVIDEEQRHGDEMAELEESRRERQSRRRQQIAAAIGVGSCERPQLLRATMVSLLARLIRGKWLLESTTALQHVDSMPGDGLHPVYAEG
ncbi:hypothetical protein MLD38_040837 [Melastoma candidum]|nr:hypothetical protein MLD38_040837 [Melastoma candidum]